jgi:hypothetical protein
MTPEQAAKNKKQPPIRSDLPDFSVTLQMMKKAIEKKEAEYPAH